MSVRTAVAAAAICLVAVIGPAHAQTAGAEDELQEIVVTAQRRSELSVDVPISVTSISGDLLERSGANQLTDIAKLTPALRFDSAGSFVQPTIRGVGTAVSTSGGGPNVGIYVDGFFSANSEVSDFQLMRVQGIEVLKGPQGTPFGRSTTGGAILVTTADPSTEPAAELNASYGTFHAVKVQGYGTIGLGERVALDLEGVFSRGDGFTTNVVTGNDEAGKYQNWSTRVGLKVRLTDSADLLLRYIHSETHDPSSELANAYVDTDGNSGLLSRVPTGAYGTNDTTGKALVYYPLTPASYATSPNQVATSASLGFTNKTDAVQATVKLDLSFAELTSYTQYRQDLSLNQEDLDATAAPLFTIQFPVDDTTISQEFLLNSKGDARNGRTAATVTAWPCSATT